MLTAKWDNYLVNYLSIFFKSSISSKINLFSWLTFFEKGRWTASLNPHTLTGSLPHRLRHQPPPGHGPIFGMLTNVRRGITWGAQQASAQLEANIIKEHQSSISWRLINSLEFISFNFSAPAGYVISIRRTAEHSCTLKQMLETYKDLEHTLRLQLKMVYMESSGGSCSQWWNINVVLSGFQRVFSAKVLNWIKFHCCFLKTMILCQDDVIINHI